MPPHVSPLPKNAKLVFKGKIFEVWQWEQKMFDGSTQTFERLRRPNTVLVIPVVGEKILVQMQEQPDWSQPRVSLPGGRCDLNEDPLAAAQRELAEESGYASDDWVLWKKQDPVIKIIWTVYTFIARNCRQKQQPRPDAGERITTKLITFDEFLLLSEDHSFYEQELGGTLLRMILDKKARAKFHRQLFGRVS